FPRRDIAEVNVVPECFAIRCLKFFTKMGAARFGAIERVKTHQLAELQEIGDASGLLQRLVELDVTAWNVHVAPELLAQRRDLRQCGFQAGLVPRHPAVFPHDSPQLAMERGDRPGSIYRKELLRPLR